MTTLRPQYSGTKRTAARSKIIAGSMLAVAELLATPEVRGGQLSPCGKCESLDGFVPPDEIDDEIRRMVGKYRGDGGKKNVTILKVRNVVETHLYPEFI